MRLYGKCSVFTRRKTLHRNYVSRVSQSWVICEIIVPTSLCSGWRPGGTGGLLASWVPSHFLPGNRLTSAIGYRRIYEDNLITFDVLFIALAGNHEPGLAG